jgi:hypothetical protein
MLAAGRSGDAAKSADRSLGPSRPKFNLTPHQLREAIVRRERGELLTEIVCTYNVSDSTTSRLKA